MSDNPPFGEGFPNPFGGMPFFNDLMKAMSQQGALNWDLATQFANLGAIGDTSDPQPDPAIRLKYNSLADIASMHVRQVSGLATADTRPEFHTTTRALWAHRTLQDLRPLFTEMATALSSRRNNTPAETDADPMIAMLGNLSSMMAPAMLGMSIGSMVGALARRAFGQYDLPVPRPPAHDLQVVSPSIDTFASEWSLAVDDLRMWVIIHELASHAVLTSPGITDGYLATIRSFVRGFSPDPNALMESLGDLDPADPNAMAIVQAKLGDPLVMMGALQSPEQEAIQPLLDAHVSAISGYIDHIVDAACERVLGNANHIAEAVRRRRIEFGSDAQLIERLLGVSLSRQRQVAGREFVQGVVERAGAEALAQLVASPTNMPTPNEIAAPGLWLARLEIQ